MNVLIACEYSGTVRDAFTRAGHYAVSCDLLPTESPGLHHQGDIVEALSPGGALSHIKWDLMIAHPDCTYLTCSAEWCYKDRELQTKKLSPSKLYGVERRAAREKALKFVRWLMDLPIPHIAIENPVGVISTRICKADQYIQPYEYGEDASKRTGLWLKGLPILQGTEFIPGRMVCECGHTFKDDAQDKYGCPDCCGDNIARPRWSNQTDSGQNRLPPSTDRWKQRALFYQGWANVMAQQWSTL